jgi:hypothetical protein
MRLSATTEWIVIGVLILYIAFTPGIPMVRQFLSTQVGKAVGLAAVVYVWKYVSEPVALLLTVNFVRCAGMREYLDMPESHCPSGYTLQNGTCKSEGKPDKPATVCGDAAKPKWDPVAEKCVAADATTTMGTGGSAGSSSSSSSSSTRQTFVDLTPDSYAGAGVQPTEKKETFTGGLDFAPVS